MVSSQTVFTYPFTMQSYKSYDMVSPQTVFTYPLHHAKLQILLHCVTTNSLYLSSSPCKATNLTAWCHRKQSLLILFTMQSYKSYYMVSLQTVFTYPLHHAKLQILLHGCHRKQSLLILFHHAKLQILLHGVTTNSLYLSSSPCKATNLTTWCHHKQSLLILFTMQSYKSYYMGVTANSLYLSFFTMQSYKSYYIVSPQTVFTYPLHHAKLQILLHCLTTNSLYLSFSPCKATNLTTLCHHKQSLLILFTMQSYKSYYIVSLQTVFTYPFHHAKLQILLHCVTTNSLYLSSSPCKATNLTTLSHYKQSLLILFHHAKLQILQHCVTTNSLYLSSSPCKATNLTTWCHHKQSLLILFTMQSYKSYYMVSPQTVFTYPLHHAKLQILLHGCHRKQSLLILFHHAKLQILLHCVTTNSLYLSSSPCKATNLTTLSHYKQSLLILFTMQSYKSYYIVSPQTVFTYPLHHAKLQILLHGVTRKQSLLILFTMQSYKSYCMVSPQTVFTYPLPHAKLQILLHGVTASRKLFNHILPFSHKYHVINHKGN